MKRDGDERIFHGHQASIVANGVESQQRAEFLDLRGFAQAIHAIVDQPGDATAEFALVDTPVPVAETVYLLFRRAQFGIKLGPETFFDGMAEPEFP